MIHRRHEGYSILPGIFWMYVHTSSGYWYVGIGLALKHKRWTLRYRKKLGFIFTKAVYD